MAVRPYDHERDDLEVIERVDDILLAEPIDLADYTGQVATQCGKLAAALNALLLNPVSPIARQIGREVSDEFEQWWERTQRDLTGTAEA